MHSQESEWRTHGIDGDDNGLGGDLVPGYVQPQLVDVTIDKLQGKV